MKLSNPKLFYVVYHGQQADGTAGAQMPMNGGRSYVPLNDILPPPDEDMMYDIGEELVDEGGTQHPNPRIFPTMEGGFQKFGWIGQKRMIRHQRSHEVVRKCALGLLAADEECLVADEDVAWLHRHDHIVNSPTAGSLANGNCTCSNPAANWLL